MLWALGALLLQLGLHGDNVSSKSAHLPLCALNLELQLGIVSFELKVFVPKILLRIPKRGKFVSSLRGDSGRTRIFQILILDLEVIVLLPLLGNGRVQLTSFVPLEL